MAALGDSPTQSFRFQWSRLPGGQMHSKLPLVLTQPWSQLPLFMLHSSTSGSTGEWG